MSVYVAKLKGKYVPGMIVVVAWDKENALRMIHAQLMWDGSTEEVPITEVKEVDLTQPGTFMFLNGDY